VSGFEPIARADEIPPGTGKQLVLGPYVIALFNVDGTFYAIDGVCLHRGGPVGEGDLDGAVVTCPWHGFQYDVRTGRMVTDPEVGLERYEIEVVDGVICVALE
jgi:nitrite reductase/ring-hydroxylating ferredoxin subunit